VRRTKFTTILKEEGENLLLFSSERGGKARKKEKGRFFSGDRETSILSARGYSGERTTTLFRGEGERDSPLRPQTIEGRKEPFLFPITPRGRGGAFFFLIGRA